MASDGLLSLRWNNHHTSFMQALSTLRNKESYSDITLACAGKFYSVHKLILSTCSDYFVEIMSRTPCKHPIIVLKDIRHQDLEALLNYMYLGEVNVVQNELASLIKAAECLKIKGLAVPDESPLIEEDSKNLEVNYEKGKKERKRRYEDDSAEVDFCPASKKSSQRTRENSEGISMQSDEINIDESTPVCTNQQKNKVFDTDCREGQQEVLPTLLEKAVIKEEELLKYEDEDGLPITGTDKNIENQITESGHVSQDPEISAEPGDQIKYHNSIAEEDRGDSHNPSITQHYPHQPQTFEEIVSQALPGSSLQSDAGQSWDGLQSKRDVTPFHLQGFTEEENLSPHHRSLQPIGCIEDTFPNMRGSVCSEGRVTIGQYGIDMLPQLNDSRMDIDNGRHAREWRCLFPECGYVTDRESWLRQHFRKHTGEKPFSCSFCSFRSAQKGNLNVHIKRVHGVEPISSADDLNAGNSDYLTIS